MSSVLQCGGAGFRDLVSDLAASHPDDNRQSFEDGKSESAGTGLDTATAFAGFCI